MGIKKASTANAPARAKVRAPDPDCPDEDIPTIPEPVKPPPPCKEEFVYRDTLPRFVIARPC